VTLFEKKVGVISTVPQATQFV